MVDQTMLSNLQRIKAPSPPELLLRRKELSYEERFIDWNPVAMKHKCLFYSFCNFTGKDIDISLYPDPTITIAFVYNGDDAKGYIRGYNTKRRNMTIKNGMSYFCVKPLSVSGICLEIGSLVDTATDIQCVIADTDIADRIAQAKNIDDRIAIFQKCSMHYLIDMKYTTDLAEYSSAIITCQRGNIKVETLSDMVYYSNTRCRTKFKQLYGISPKRFARVLRISTAVYRMRLVDYSTLTELAIECGYTDQAHFIHDCEKTIGLTPSEIADALHHH